MAYGQVLKKMVENKSKESFILLAMFTKVVVPVVKDKRTVTIRAARNIEYRIRRWRNGDHMALWQEAQAMTGADTREKKGKKKKKSRLQWSTQTGPRS